MSRFKRIKNTLTKKSSVSIDEKIDALNKELEKTGMSNVSEMMTTDNVYSTSTYVPPQERVVGDVPNSSNIGGDGFTQSSAGSGTEGHAPSYSSVEDLFNSGVNHPIFQTPSSNGVPVSYGVVKYSGTGAATNYGIIEGGNIVRLVLGGYIAGGTRPPSYYVNIYNSYLQTNQHSPGYYSDEVIETKRIDAELATQVAAIRDSGLAAGYEFNVSWSGYRQPQFMESLEGRTTFTHQTKGLLVLSGFQLLGMPNTYTIQEPKPPGTTDPIRRGLEDPPIYPGRIPPGMDPKMSEAAYEELRRRAEEAAKKKKGEQDKGENDEGEEDDGPLVYGMTQEEVERKFGHLDDDGLAREGIKRLPDGSYREMTQAEINAFKQKVYEENLKKIAYNVGLNYSKVRSLFDRINPIAKLDNILKGNSGVKELDKLLDPLAAAFGKGIASRAFKGKFQTPANVMFRYDKWLASGAKGRVDVTNEISTKDMKKLSSKLHNFSGKSPDWWVNHYQNLPKTNANYAATREDALKILSNDIQRNMDSIMKEEGSGLSMTFQNNVQLDTAKYIASGGKTIELTKTYKFSERTGSVKGFSNTVLGQLLMGMGVELDQFGTGGLHNTAITLLGAKYGLRTVNRQYGGKADRAPGMPMKIRIPSNVTESVGSFDAYMNSANLLTEGVGLGHFEPEELNVDIEDLRKGIMPEYPKKPPAKMIDGYHQDSKLKPKEFKDKYLLKIDEKDLLRNHRLKKGEADEMINTVKMINDYLSEHPEDLIYVQQRYPVDDPRLAELNYKMDMMLGASKEYMDSNFKENKKLFKRATDRTKKNIKLTDPEYVQQKYDELRGTPKPKKTKLVGRLGKHLNKYESKSLFKHVNSKNFKKINERKIERKEQVKQIQNEIEIEFQEKKNDWRKDLGNNTY